jgi:hypothetical protein
MDANEATPLITPGIYLHTKTGNYYQVIGIALHTETTEKMVIYKPQYASGVEFFARPYTMFNDTITLEGNKRPRFERIDK